MKPNTKRWALRAVDCVCVGIGVTVIANTPDGSLAVQLLYFATGIFLIRVGKDWILS